MRTFRNLFTGLVLTLLSVQPIAAQVSFGNAKLFNDDWLFVLDNDSADAANTTFSDKDWRKLNLPHDWSVEQQLSPTMASCMGYLPGGIGWYRKHFTVDDDAPCHYIYFEGVYNRSEVYLNGKLLGKRPNGYISFMYDMTPYLKKGENVIAVRVDHSRNADSRWYTGSGIYRDVWMVSAPEIHFAQWGVAWNATSITDKKAEVNVEAEVNKNVDAQGKLEIVAQLTDAQGNVVATGKTSIANLKKGISKTNIKLSVKNPKRWNLASPYLYNLTTELMENGKMIDKSETRVGLRTLQFDANKGFALNGKWMKVKGVCLHHDAGVLGAVVPKEVWHQRLLNLKEIGTNAIRMSHNPQAPILYDLCDELGLLVMDEASDEWEFPKRKWIKGWNKGVPGFQGTYDFFEEWINQDVTDMVRRDRNHPSVFLWSIGNEVDYPNDPYSHPVLNGSKINQPMFGGYNPKAPDAMRIGAIAKRLAACVRAIDTSRPVTGALAGVIMSNETDYPQAVDVVGYNYTEDRYDMDHKKYPKRVIYGSETGTGIDAWYAVKNNDFIFGQFIWTGIDYMGESREWPSRGLNTGLLDFGGFVKPRGHFRASLWCDKPVTYIGTYPKVLSSLEAITPSEGKRKHPDYLSVDAWDTWNYDEGDIIRVVCYTNAPQARLMLNDEIVAPLTPYDTKNGMIHWDIPYRPGVLKAQGCDASGKVVSEYTIKTSSSPYALRVSVDKSKLSSARATALITVEVVDKNGDIVKLGDNDITCLIGGPAHLLGLEGSDNRDMSDYTDNHQRAYHGRLLCYIQTIDKKGPIKVMFTSPLLKRAVVELTAE